MPYDVKARLALIRHGIAVSGNADVLAELLAEVPAKIEEEALLRLHYLEADVRALVEATRPRHTGWYAEAGV